MGDSSAYAVNPNPILAEIFHESDPSNGCCCIPGVSFPTSFPPALHGIMDAQDFKNSLTKLNEACKNPPGYANKMCCALLWCPLIPCCLCYLSSAGRTEAARKRTMLRDLIDQENAFYLSKGTPIFFSLEAFNYLRAGPRGGTSTVRDQMLVVRLLNGHQIASSAQQPFLPPIHTMPAVTPVLPQPPPYHQQPNAPLVGSQHAPLLASQHAQPVYTDMK